MKRLSLIFATALLLCASVWAQTPAAYTFQDISYPKDTFTQLLGINNNDLIVGYHNFNTNSGFTLNLPATFKNQNFPGAAMTQILGVNIFGRTVGFYVDTAGITHGFRNKSGFYKVDFPGSKFNQLLGLNDNGQSAGYYSQSVNNTTPDVPYIYDETGGIFQVIVIPQAVGGAQATGINNSQQISGFYIDSKGVNHGFLLNFGVFKTLDFPGSTFTQALGLNNAGQVVGAYMDTAGGTHGFIYGISHGTYTSVDDPNGVGSTVVNGINDHGHIVGFWGTAPTNTGFFAK